MDKCLPSGQITCPLGLVLDQLSDRPGPCHLREVQAHELGCENRTLRALFGDPVPGGGAPSLMAEGDNIILSKDLSRVLHVLAFMS